MGQGGAALSCEDIHSHPSFSFPPFPSSFPPLPLGIAECFVGHPLDTIKVRMQAATAGQASGAAVAVAGVAKMNAVQLLRSTIKHEGLLALYRGASSRVVGSALANSVLFGANGAFKKLFDADTALPLSGAFILASACTGAAEAAIWTPMGEEKGVI